ncbi:syntaxin-4 isoform X1 [Struthio camelus]|uniref:syntaxin-4 isoform X1 n=1 Tax=Struthio camelus TaxID=8801 RepID=UPI0036042A90
MRDRTRELRQDSLSSDEDNGSDEASPEHVTLVGLRPRPAPAPPGADALEQARGVRAALRTLELKVAALERQQDTVLGTPLPDEGLKRELQTLRDEIRELTGDARARLKALEPGPEEEDENRNCLGSRVRRTQHGVLSQQLLALAARCQAAQAGYRERNVARIRRQLSIAGGGTVSEEELEQMLETGQSEVFVANPPSPTRVGRGRPARPLPPSLAPTGGGGAGAGGGAGDAGGAGRDGGAARGDPAAGAEPAGPGRPLRPAGDHRGEPGGGDRPHREEHPGLGDLRAQGAGAAGGGAGEPARGAPEEAAGGRLPGRGPGGAGGRRRRRPGQRLRARASPASAMMLTSLPAGGPAPSCTTAHPPGAAATPCPG